MHDADKTSAMEGAFFGCANSFQAFLWVAPFLAISKIASFLKLWSGKDIEKLSMPLETGLSVFVFIFQDFMGKHKNYGSFQKLD